MLDALLFVAHPDRGDSAPVKSLRMAALIQLAAQGLGERELRRRPALLAKIGERLPEHRLGGFGRAGEISSHREILPLCVFRRLALLVGPRDTQPVGRRIGYRSRALGELKGLLRIAGLLGLGKPETRKRQLGVLHVAALRVLLDVRLEKRLGLGRITRRMGGRRKQEGRIFCRAAAAERNRVGIPARKIVAPCAYGNRVPDVLAFRVILHVATEQGRSFAIALLAIARGGSQIQRLLRKFAVVAECDLKQKPDGLPTLGGIL